MKKLNPKIDEIQPGQIAHVIKFCIDDNDYLDLPKSTEILRDLIQVHLLPVCRVLNYLINQKTIEFLIIPHPEEIIQNVPRYSRDIHTKLNGGKMMADYLKGLLKIHDITDEKFLYGNTTVHRVITKKIANLLQSFTLTYNAFKKKTCRLTQRKYVWHKVPKSKVKDLISMQAALSAAQGEKLDPIKSAYSGFQDIMNQDSNVINNEFITRYNKNIRKEMKLQMNRFRIGFGTGIKDRELLRRSSIDWLYILKLKPG